MKIEKVEKLVTNLHDKSEHVVHIKNLKQALNHGFIWKKSIDSSDLIKMLGSKPYVDMNTKLKQKTKNNFEKDFFKRMNNAVFGKTIENERKLRNIKFVTAERRRNYLVPEPNYRITKIFMENLLAIGMRKTQILMNKAVWILVWLCKTKVWWKCKTLQIQISSLFM